LTFEAWARHVKHMLLATILTSITTALTIVIHYEALKLVHAWHLRKPGGTRASVITCVFFLFAAHAAEVWLFAGALYIAMEQLHLGTLEGAFDGTWRDYLYFSVVTYASVGYGDIRPTGYLRTISGFAALTGILMMAWSAAYTVFRLQRHWTE
jgi:hypothetical protein